MPTTVRRILCATDFSSTADRALAWAEHLARLHRAAGTDDVTLHLVHAVSPIEPVQDHVTLPIDFREALLESSRSRLRRLEGEVAERLQGSGVHLETHLEVAQPSQVVLTLALELPADVAVVGTRGLTGLEHLFLGSTAQRIVQRAHCPVLAIHPDDEAPGQVERLLVPVDFRIGPQAAVAAARTVFVGNGGKRPLLRLVHVFHVPPEYSSYGSEGLSAMSRRYRDSMVEALSDDLSRVADRLRTDGYEVEMTVAEGNPPRELATEAERWGADAIALATHGRRGLPHLLLGSTAERTVQLARRPVLTVRPEQAA